MSHETLDEAAVTFLAVRDRLFGIAFRILNDCAEAEDIVQDAWLRWQTCDRSVVLDPLAFLTTTTKRLCINTMQSARARHEIHTGLMASRSGGPQRRPAAGVEQCEALELAALTLLERLSPTGARRLRAAGGLRLLVCRDRRDRVGDQANARQLVSRARKRLAAERREPHRRGAEAAGGGVDGRRAIGRPGDPGNVFTEDLALAA